MIPEIISIRHDDGSGFRAAWMDNESSFLHLHPEYEIVLNISGNGTRVAGDSVELFDRYDLVMYGPDLRHFWNFYRKDKNDTGRHAIMVHFRRDSLGESMLSQFEMADLRRLLENAGRGIAFSPETGEKAEEPMRRMLSDTGMKKMVSFFRLLEILCSAPKFKILSGENLEGVREITDSRLAEVCSFIRENFYRPIPVKEIAVVAKMSPHSFSRFFSRSTGSGFVNYVNQVRTNKACYLLRETDHQINEIVYECGFATISNFNKQFRKHAGMSARDYRAQYRT
ncbi:MAG TPA: AraC family transcriptional regulator [Bacteroidales bacterium]|jgi:AraC-like DNA-binding protein|nr:helix-turn-helix domain-containing protein [Bacteroidales bacterium]MBP7037195.1 helix-turn-helix domain-containing protein [Bacteroidales bacterium]MBP8710356.1 helix-turn-helix domain-containing protein [Bacteroidales bacterium]HNV67157.1 AraC family transcriptional regulator [Bacteroidales bacterium]HNY58586.1 AraC family transcriptional regulator [Bacteroidales bacterium]